MVYGGVAYNRADMGSSPIGPIGENMKLWIIRRIPVEKSYKIKDVDREFFYTEFCGYEKICELHLASTKDLQDSNNSIYLENESGSFFKLEYDAVVTERLKK